MKKKSKSAFKKYIHGMCQELRSVVFCGEYTMDIVWEIEKEKEGSEGKDTKCGAEIWINTKYLQFVITIYPSIFKYYQEDKYSRICEVLMHEFCHLLTEPLYLFGVDAITNAEQKHLEEVRERQTQRICNTIMYYLPKSIYLPKVAKKKK